MEKQEKGYQSGYEKCVLECRLIQTSYMDNDNW
jgi:hypothetical protein